MSAMYLSQSNPLNQTSTTLDTLPLTNQPLPLSNHIENSVRQYFDEIADQTVTDVYDLMLQQFERPLLTVMFEQTRGNQTLMAEILGLNRGTLRKKLKRYDFIK